MRIHDLYRLAGAFNADGTERVYDAIVLDLMMPRGNGFDILNFLNEEHLPVPCIVISAAAQQVLDGVDGPNIVAKLRKPFNIGDLVDAATRSLAS